MGLLDLFSEPKPKPQQIHRWDAETKSMRPSDPDKLAARTFYLTQEATLPAPAQPAPVVRPTPERMYVPSVVVAASNLQAARQGLADHLSRITDLETRLNEVNQAGQAAAPGSSERAAAGQQMLALDNALRFERGDRARYDQEIERCEVDLQLARLREKVFASCHAKQPVETATAEVQRLEVELAAARRVLLGAEQKHRALSIEANGALNAINQAKLPALVVWPPAQQLYQQFCDEFQEQEGK